jgi:adenylate cyclase class 2
METEIEAKFLDIDPESIRTALARLGARQEHPEILMKRTVFDYPDGRLEKIGGWIRVRDEGKNITFTYKQLNNRTLHGTKEITTFIDDFDKTCKILEAIGLAKRSYQETKREKWLLGESEITIDTWPWIPTFVEIESPTEEELREIALKLDLDWQYVMHGSVETAYQKYYDVTEQEIDHWESVTFIPVPNWLEEKKK